MNRAARPQLMFLLAENIWSPDREFVQVSLLHHSLRLAPVLGLRARSGHSRDSCVFGFQLCLGALPVHRAPPTSAFLLLTSARCPESTITVSSLWVPIPALEEVDLVRSLLGQQSFLFSERTHCTQRHTQVMGWLTHWGP